MNTSDNAARIAAAAERLQRINVGGEDPDAVYENQHRRGRDGAFNADCVEVLEGYRALQARVAELEADGRRWDYLRREFARHNTREGWDIPRIYIGSEDSTFSEAFDALMARGARLQAPEG